jgi:hypothetical protein
MMDFRLAYLGVLIGFGFGGTVAMVFPQIPMIAFQLCGFFGTGVFLLLTMR